MHLSSCEKPWGKAFTNKRYINTPFSEMMATMWPSTMVLLGEIKGGENSQVTYGGRWNESAIPSVAVMFTVNNELLPYTKVKYGKRKDGIPIHSLSHEVDGVTLYEEAFSDFSRVPIVYVKIKLTNNSIKNKVVRLGAIVRRGAEFDLMGSICPDGYLPAIPDEERFANCEKFRFEDDSLTLGDYRFSQQENYVFTESERDIFTTVSLGQAESKTFYFTFTRSSVKPQKYSVARATALRLWKRELNKAKNIPDVKKELPLFNNLLSGMLQMFFYPKDCDYVLLRQGGIQRYVWVGEAIEVFKALTRIVGYEDYLEKVLDTYFNVFCQHGKDEGKIKTFGIDWAATTATAIESFSYVAKNSTEVYEKYIEQAMTSFRWIERQRALTYDSINEVGGLFPTARACDSDCVSQIWGVTDNFNIYSYGKFVEMLKERNSKYFSEVKLAYDGYYKAMQDNFNRIVNSLPEKSDGFIETANGFKYKRSCKSAIIMPINAKGDEKTEVELRKAFIFQPMQFYTFYLANGFAGYGTETAKSMIRAFKDFTGKGLICPNDKSSSGTGYRWYVSMAEYYLFEYYGKTQETAKQKELLEGQIKYGVTNEYIAYERYDSRDAMFAPWLPNASANGRLVSMLFSYYGSVKVTD